MRELCPKVAGKRCKQAAETCVLLAKEQLRAGRQAVWVWPESTTSWTSPNIREFFRFTQQSGQLHESRIPLQLRVRWIQATSESSSCAPSTSPESLGELSPALRRRVLREMVTHRTMHENVMKLWLVNTNLSLITRVNLPWELRNCKTRQKLTKDEKVIHAQLMKLHRRCGHPSNRALINLLKTREVDPQVIRIAEKLRCDACQQMQLSSPHGKVALDRPTLAHSADRPH